LFLEDEEDLLRLLLVVVLVLVVVTALSHNSCLSSLLAALIILVDVVQCVCIRIEDINRYRLFLYNLELRCGIITTNKKARFGGVCADPKRYLKSQNEPLYCVLLKKMRVLV